jgi:glycosyltransferase involved in cell wall biosynthesis
MARQIAVHLDRSRVETVFCISRREPQGHHEPGIVALRDAGVPVLSLDRESRFDLRPWKRLVGCMRRWGADVLHTHKIGSNAWGALLGPVGRVPVFVAHEHGWSFEGQPLRRFLDRELIARRADAFIAVSREDLHRMHSVEKIPLEKLRFIPNGIPTPDAPNTAADVRVELSIAPDQPVIGAVATLWPEKALDVLIRAAASLATRFSALRVLSAGGEASGPDGAHGSEREKLMAVAAELGIADRVRFLGRRSDVPSVLAALDVAVLCSNTEGSPLAVMEYMEAGKPVVATRVGGVPDLVQEGVTGLLVEPQDPEGLAAAIGQLLDNPDRAAEMGRAGRERRRSEFSIETTARRVEALYEELYAVKAGGESQR